MQWSIAFDDYIEVLHATVSGEVTAEGFKALQAELLVESKCRDLYRCLCDCRNAGVRMTLAEANALPRQLRAMGMASYCLVAVVYSDGPDVTPLFQAFDERCDNAGLSQKAFADYDEACEWLIGMDLSTVSNPMHIML